MSYATSVRVAGLLLVLFAAAAPVSALTITSPTPPEGRVGVHYDHKYQLCFGSLVCQLLPDQHFSVTAGELPPGLSLGREYVFGNRSRGDWHLSGTPTTVGTYTGTVTASARGPDGQVTSGSQAFYIVIVNAPPVITGSGPPSGSVGAPYTFNFAATGSPPITYKLTAGELPDGLTLSTAGLVSGTPTTAGSFAGTVTASNGTLPDGVLSFTIVIAGPPPLITSSAPPDGSVGVPYTFTYTATGSVPITYNVTAGALPYGLTLSTAGVIDGTPTTDGTYTGTVTASNGISPDNSQNFSIVIKNVPPVFTNSPPQSGTVGAPYTFAYTASGTPPITYSVTAGALPDGLTLSSDGVIDGTPTTEGTYSGTFTASNGTAPDATQEFSITIILQGPPHITSSPPPGGAAGNPYTFTYTATGATNVTYSVTSGELPPGLYLGSELRRPRRSCRDAHDGGDVYGNGDGEQRRGTGRLAGFQHHHRRSSASHHECTTHECDRGRLLCLQLHGDWKHADVLPRDSGGLTGRDDAER